MKTLKSLEIEYPYDSSPDLSYLEQDYADEPSPVRRNQYRKQDRERLAAYNAGDWHMVGVVAVATVEIDTGADPAHGVHWRTEHTFKSAGVWGVESDAGDWLTEIASDELIQLREILAELGIEWNESLAEQALA
jgi:hypothetical protein